MIVSGEGFEQQWAVMMPNGELYCDRTEHDAAAAQTSAYYVMISPLRDMFGMTEPKTQPTVVKPSIFDKRVQADKLLADLVKQAKAFGVDNWGGTVVSRICSPFIAPDPYAAFGEAVVTWAHENGGAS